MYRKNLVATIEEREGGGARQRYGIKKYKLYFILFLILFMKKFLGKQVIDCLKI